MIVIVSPAIVTMLYTALMVVAKIDKGTAAAGDLGYKTRHVCDGHQLTRGDKAYAQVVSAENADGYYH